MDLDFRIINKAIVIDPRWESKMANIQPFIYIPRHNILYSHLLILNIYHTMEKKFPSHSVILENTNYPQNKFPTMSIKNIVYHHITLQQ